MVIKFVGRKWFLNMVAKFYAFSFNSSKKLMKTEIKIMGFDDCHKKVVGSLLTNLFFTEQNGPHDYCPGIPPAYYFSTILELDGCEKYLFSNDFMIKWNDDEPIIPLTNENWNLPVNLVFREQKIVDLIKDDEGQFSFHLEN
jgi:hypothetical protein